MTTDQTSRRKSQVVTSGRSTPTSAHGSYYTTSLNTTAVAGSGVGCDVGRSAEEVRAGVAGSQIELHRRRGDLANEAETIARVHGTSVNQLIIDSLSTEIDRVRSDADFMSRARRLLERDQAIIDRLAE